MSYKKSNRGSGDKSMVLSTHRWTKEKFIEKALLIHGDKYGYDKVIYNGIFEPVIIFCKEHGDYEEIPRGHLRGKICPLCSQRFSTSPLNKLNNFIFKAEKKHNNKYDYTKFSYESRDTKSIIICPEHGEFLQTPGAHLSQGQGCPKCAVLQRHITIGSSYSGHFTKTHWRKFIIDNKGYFYVLRCWNDSEEFIKIGITKKDSIKKRYKYKSAMPYRFETLLFISGEPDIIWNLERNLLKKYKSSIYIPKIRFNGSLECINIVNKENIVTDATLCQY